MVPSSGCYLGPVSFPQMLVEMINRMQPSLPGLFLFAEFESVISITVMHNRYVHENQSTIHIIYIQFGPSCLIHFKGCGLNRN